jgi:hypothetical protein
MFTLSQLVAALTVFGWPINWLADEPLTAQKNTTAANRAPTFFKRFLTIGVSSSPDGYETHFILKVLKSQPSCTHNTAVTLALYKVKFQGFVRNCPTKVLKNAKN